MIGLYGGTLTDEWIKGGKPVILTRVFGRERRDRLVKFVFIGGSVTLLGIAGLYLLVDKLQIQENLAYFLLTVVSLQVNFVLSDRITWSKAGSQGGFWRRWTKFHISRGIVAGLCQLLFALCMFMGLHYMLANFSGIVFATGLNFVAGEWFVFRSSDNLGSTHI